MEPLEVHVKISVDDETLELRAKAAELQEMLVDAKRQLNDLEFRYRCECIVNAELVDLCRAHGVRYRPSLAARPWESGGP